MITREPSFVTSDRQRFDTLDAAIGHELGLLMEDSDPKLIGEAIPAWIMANRDKIVDLLTTKTSKPRARKINGASKKRTTLTAEGNAALNRALQDGKQ